MQYQIEYQTCALMGRLRLSVTLVTHAGITTLLCCSVMSEDNTESTEQIVPAAQKVPETTAR